MQNSDMFVHTFFRRIYGPNSEIEWNKEGSRGFLIINRKPSQTALASVADKASELAATLNKNLKNPSDTSRDRVLHVENDNKTSDKLVDSDPSSVNILYLFVHESFVIYLIFKEMLLFIWIFF